MLFAFSRQQWFRESASMLRHVHIACLVVYTGWNKCFRTHLQMTLPQQCIFYSEWYVTMTYNGSSLSSPLYCATLGTQGTVPETKTEHNALVSDLCCRHLLSNISIKKKTSSGLCWRYLLKQKKKIHRLQQGCTNPWRQVTGATICTVKPDICGSSVRHLIHVTLLAPRILWWRLSSCKNLCTFAIQ